MYYTKFIIGQEENGQNSKYRNLIMPLSDKLNSLLVGGSIVSPIRQNMYTTDAEEVPKEYQSFRNRWISEIIPLIVNSLYKNMGSSFDYAIKNGVDLVIYIKKIVSKPEMVNILNYEPTGVISVKPESSEKNAIFTKINIQAGYNQYKAGNTRTIDWKLKNVFDQNEYVINIVNNIITLGKSLKIINEETNLGMKLLNEINVQKLIANTDIGRKNRAKKQVKTTPCKLTKLFADPKSKLFMLEYNCKSYPSTEGKRQYGYVIHDSVTRDIKELWCSCKDYYYRLQAPLVRGKLASFGPLPNKYSAKAPMVHNRKWTAKTNPTGRLYLCKHLYAVIGPGGYY